MMLTPFVSQEQVHKASLSRYKRFQCMVHAQAVPCHTCHTACLDQSLQDHFVVKVYPSGKGLVPTVYGLRNSRGVESTTQR